MKLNLGLKALALGCLLFATEALAVIGRPLTPVSYAGVARRTTRHEVAAVDTAAAVGTAAAISSLPPGCVQVMHAGLVYKQCGAAIYQPVYQGPNLVYVPAHF